MLLIIVLYYTGTVHNRVKLYELTKCSSCRLSLFAHEFHTVLKPRWSWTWVRFLYFSKILVSLNTG